MSMNASRASHIVDAIAATLLKAIGSAAIVADTVEASIKIGQAPTAYWDNAAATGSQLIIPRDCVAIFNVAAVSGTCALEVLASSSVGMGSPISLGKITIPA